MHSLTSEANINNVSIKLSKEKLDVTESSKKEILRTEMTDKEMQGKLRISWFSPNAQFEIYASFLWVLHEGVCSFNYKKQIEFNISVSEMLQKEDNRSYSLFPNESALSKLRTCACFPVTSVPRVASAAVRANSIRALRVHVTGGS